MREDRLLLGQTSSRQVLRRWEWMGKPDLRSLKREAVERMLGEHLAACVVRRRKEG